MQENPQNSVFGLVTSKLIHSGRQYLSERNAGTHNSFILELNVMAEATLLDRLTDSNLGTQMWMIFYFRNHEDWEEIIWQLLYDYETTKTKNFFNVVEFHTH